MIEIQPFDRLGRFRNEWLNTRYHFSFADYVDPRRMGWGPLRVWNDDAIAPGSGFPMHPHRDMEIITYVREGAISHRDHLGNERRTAAGQVQVMSAGTGIMHSEFNDEDEETRLFQIWIMPRIANASPNWGTRDFPVQDRSGRLVALASGEPGHADVLPINQDATLYAATVKAGDVVGHDFAPARRGYLVPARGRIAVNGIEIGARDGAAIADTGTLAIEALEDSEIVLVDLP